MARQRVQTRCDDDTVAAIDEYREAGDTPDISEAEAVRRLLRAGLAAKGHPVAGYSDSIVVRARQAGNVIDVAQFALLAMLLFLGIGLATGSI